MRKRLEQRISDIEEKIDASRGLRIIWEPSSSSGADAMDEDEGRDDVRTLRIHWKGKQDNGTTLSA